MIKNLQSLLLFFFFLPVTVLFAQTSTLKPTLELRTSGEYTIPYQNGFPLPSFEKQSRNMINLAGTWKKQRFTASEEITMRERDDAGIQLIETEAAGRESADFDDSAWEEKELPGVENNLNPANTPPEIYQDGVWYRRSFDVDTENSGQFAKLIFYSVNYVADVWLNGHYLGYHEGGYTPFAFDVSGRLAEGTNVIAVRVHNIRWGSRHDIVPPYQSDWFNYTGIIHDVYLEFSDHLAVVRTDVVPVDLGGNISVKTVLMNNYLAEMDVHAEIKVYEASIDSLNIESELASDLIGNEVTLEGETAVDIHMDSFDAVWETSLKIPEPKIWSPKEPNLYIMRVTLTLNGNVIDEYHTQFGIRTVSTSGNKFTLNDKVVFLTGLARHEEHPDYGRSVPKDIIFSDLQTVKSLNANFLRTAHYPNHPYTYITADRLGITIMEEIPVWWFDTAEPWAAQNTRKIHLQMFREMAFKDYNRPSIILWSTSNECKEETNRVEYNQMLVNDLRANYDDKRLISQSSAGDNPGSDDITQGPLDVAGWTLYFGIFHGSTYFGGTFTFLNQAKSNFPDKPIIDTEFGYWSSENNSTLEQQVTVFNETFRAFKIFASLNENGTLNSNGCLMASTWWCVFDWYQPKANGYQTMGLISMNRETYKPVANTLKAAYFPYFNHEGVVTSLEDEVRSPYSFELLQNYPNPFNPSTTIKYETAVSGVVTVKVYDVLGREAAVLVNEEQAAGSHSLQFNSAGLTSGVYFYTVNANGQTLTKKMILLK